MTMITIGIIGAGKIAGLMGVTLQGMDTVTRYAIAARDYNRAKAFADKYGFEKAYGSYEDMLADSEVDLVYIATPHSHHYDHVKLCLEHGKHVLCEKAFTVNERQARELFAMAKEKGLLLTEAIWTRYMPMRRTLDEVLASGVIGTPHMLEANLSYLIGWKDRIAKPELAGGALLDIGIYTLNFASMVFGDDIESITGTAVFNENGMDMQETITLIYEDGRMAALNASALSLSDRRGIIYGDKGYIETENINNCGGIKVYDLDRKLVAVYETPKQITGYEYEVEACVYAIEHGETECSQMPHEETLRMMGWMDELRRQWGIVYPMEGSKGKSSDMHDAPGGKMKWIGAEKLAHPEGGLWQMTRFAVPRVKESGLYYDRSINVCPSSQLSYDIEYARELWNASERYVKLFETEGE